MPSPGCERRRTDLYGRARRLIYGLLLAAAAPGAMAADPLAELGRYGASLKEGLRVNLAVPELGVVHVKVSSSPELRMEFQGVQRGLHPVEASLTYNNAGGFSEDKVPQVSLRWRL